MERKHCKSHPPILRFGSRVGLLALSLLLAGPAAGTQQDNNPQKKENKEAAGANGPKSTTSESTPATGPDYRIGPQDVLAINVWREPEISRTVVVRPDGKISLPLIGEIVANGLTPMELDDKVTAGLQAFLAAPEVTVIVQTINSRKFNILGEVTRPGVYSLTSRMTVLDAIAQAGGPRDFANVKRIYVLRRLENGQQRIFPFNYKDVLRGKKLHQNVELEDGDTIVIP